MKESEDIVAQLEHWAQDRLLFAKMCRDAATEIRRLREIVAAGPLQDGAQSDN